MSVICGEMNAASVFPGSQRAACRVCPRVATISKILAKKSENKFTVLGELRHLLVRQTQLLLGLDLGLDLGLNIVAKKAQNFSCFSLIQLIYQVSSYKFWASEPFSGVLQSLNRDLFESQPSGERKTCFPSQKKAEKVVWFLIGANGPSARRMDRQLHIMAWVSLPIS